MQDFKLRHTEFIRAVGTASGRWTRRVDVPFAPKYCIVRQVTYDEDHGIGLIRAPFVQGGVLCVMSGNADIFPQSILSTPGPVSGDYEFQVVNIIGEIFDMTINNLGNIVIVLEFVA